MSGEFVDTNILVYAHNADAGEKQILSIELLERLSMSPGDSLSVQVLVEFYSAATRKLAMPGKEVEAAIADLAHWRIHQPQYTDVLRAIGLERRYKINWWDALILNSASELGCSILWTEDFNHGQKYGLVTARNPFIRATR